MNIVIYESNAKIEPWIKELSNCLPTASIHYYSDRAIETADYFICNAPLANHLYASHNIKAVFLLSAGFDYYLSLKQSQPCKLLDQVPCYRLEDAGMSDQMMDYATYSTLKFFRRFNQYDNHKTWKPLTPFSKNNFQIGIMGTGELGGNVANRLTSLGFKVNAWNRTEKNLDNVTQYIGDNEFEGFITNTHLLINLLPLNNQTTGLLNKELFQKLAKPSYLINLARGAHVVENDLIDALTSEVLSGAQLDVTQIEPLPHDSALFSQQNCFITPHIAAETLIKESCEQISKKIKCLERNKSITGKIDWPK
jgi:glyoxylate/hydroxypyruvate reductase A